MKKSISIKQLTLAAGIVVALIVAFMLATANTSFSADLSTITFPKKELPSLAKVAIQKIRMIF